MFATQVDFNYDRNTLLFLIQEIVQENQLFKKPVPISAFGKDTAKKILNMLGIEYGQQLFNFIASTVTIACLKPLERSAIHKDRGEFGYPTESALNLPLSSCKGVFMNWYSMKPNGVIKEMKSANGWTIEGLSLHNAIKQFTFPCNHPFLVDPTEFHDIVNTTDEHHLIISIR